MLYDVTALGEVLIDFATISTDGAGYPTMTARPGGAPCNYLGALNRYGRKTAFLGKVGRDAFGALLVKTLQESGIETKGVVVDDSVFTTLAFVTLDQNGDRSFSFARKPGADICLKFEELDLSIIDQSRIFHFGTLSLTDEPVCTTTHRAVAYAKRQKKCITFDPNLRTSLWRDLDQAKAQMLWGLSQADIVKLSDEEVDFLWGCDEEAGTKKLLEEHGVSLAMVTLGARGCYLATQRDVVRAKAPQVQVRDATGAGDIFGGSAVSRVLALGKQPQDLSRDELMHIASFASTAASLSTQCGGGIPSIPDRETVLAHMR